MRIALIVGLTLLLAACESTSEPTFRRPAWLGSPPRTIQAPDTVRAGVPFSATVFAAGSGSIQCNQPDCASIAQGIRVARVEIFVRALRGNVPCTDDLKYYPIPISLTFATAGVSTIRVIGTKQNSGTYALDSLERSVVVVP